VKICLIRVIRVLLGQRTNDKGQRTYFFKNAPKLRVITNHKKACFWLLFRNPSEKMHFFEEIMQIMEEIMQLKIFFNFVIILKFFIFLNHRETTMKTH